MTDLPDDLAAILAANHVPPTVDGLLREFERRGWWVLLAGPDSMPIEDDRWLVESALDGRRKQTDVYGPTALLALARAFAVMIGEGEG